MTQLLSIIGLAALCAVWVLFQQWLKRVDPERGDFEARCSGGCGSCECKSKNDDMGAGANDLMGENP